MRNFLRKFSFHLIPSPTAKLEGEYTDEKLFSLGAIIDSLDERSKAIILILLIINFSLAVATAVISLKSGYSNPFLLRGGLVVIALVALIGISFLIFLIKRNFDALLKAMFLFYVGLLDIIVIGLGETSKTYLYFLINFFAFLIFDLIQAILIVFLIFISHVWLLPKEALIASSPFLMLGFLAGILFRYIIFIINRISRIDPLTGILNRKTFFELAEKYISISNRLGVPISIALLDIDNFKAINDTYGHLTGDMVLKKIGSILRNSLRKTDIVARYGGEEFVVLLFNCDSRKAKEILEKLRRKIEEHDFYPVPKVTVSIGVTEVNPQIPLEESLKKADELLYKAKRTGKNKVVCECET